MSEKRLSLIFGCDRYSTREECFQHVTDALIAICFFILAKKYKDNGMPVKLIHSLYGNTNPDIGGDQWPNKNHQFDKSYMKLIEEQVNILLKDNFGEEIGDIEVISPKDLEESAMKWSSIRSRMEEKHSNIFLNLVKTDIRSYKSNLESYVKGNNEAFIFIDTYLDCASVLSNLRTRHDENHLLVFASEDYAKAYECVYERKRFGTVTFIVKEHDNFNLIEFDIKKRKVKIYLDKGGVSIKEKFEPMQNWMGAFFFRPDCYFSYCNGDRYNEQMDTINEEIKYYFPFLHFQRDSDGDKIFSNINNYVEKLTNGDFVVILIGQNYLKSDYPMYELSHIIDRCMTSKASATINHRADELAKNGIFILIDRDDEYVNKSIFHENNNELEKYWESRTESPLDSDKLDKIRGSVNDIRAVLSSINSIRSIKQHSEEKFSNLVDKVNIALQKRDLYIDIYDKHYPWKQS